MIGDCNLGCKNKLYNLSGRPMSTCDNQRCKENCTYRNNFGNSGDGCTQWIFAKRKMAVINEPTKLMATKKQKFEI